MDNRNKIFSPNFIKCAAVMALLWLGVLVTVTNVVALVLIGFVLVTGTAYASFVLDYREYARHTREKQ